MIDSVRQEGILARDLCGGKASPGGGLLQVHRSTRGSSIIFKDQGMSGRSENKAELERFHEVGVKQHRAVAAGIDQVCSVRNGIQQIIGRWSGKLFYATRDDPVSVCINAGGAHTGA